MKFRNKLAGFLAVLTAFSFTLTGCMDNWEDEDYSEETSADTSDVTASAANSETESSDENLQLGTGLEEIQITAMDDPNPQKKLRRSAVPIKQIRGIDLNGKSLSDDFYFYRSTLSKKSQSAYDQIYAFLYKGVSKFDMNVAVDGNSISDIIYCVYYDHPELFWVDCALTYYVNENNIVTSVQVNFNNTASNLSSSQQNFESAVAPLLSSAGTLSTDIDKVKYVHDYLTNVDDYVLNSELNQSAYSALVYGQTVCAGYAHAFQYCMQKLGIPAAYVVGNAGGGAHAWNIVCLDGEYYNMDVTWDDPVGNSPTTYYYNYFNITDSTIGSDHARDSLSAQLPSCNGTKYNFNNWYGAGYEGTDFSNFGQGGVNVAGDYNGDVTAPADQSQDVTTNANDNGGFNNDDYSDDSNYNSGDYDYDWGYGNDSYSDDGYDYSDDDSDYYYDDSGDYSSDDYDDYSDGDYDDYEDYGDYEDYEDYEDLYSGDCCDECLGIYCDGSCCDHCCMYN